jgi:hypothetical protein
VSAPPRGWLKIRTSGVSTWEFSRFSRAPAV